jgi:hypothetical protein
MYIIFHHSKRLLANCPGRIHISWFQHSLQSFMPLHHVKSHYNIILYYTSSYVERVGVSQHDNACSFITAVSTFRITLTWHCHFYSINISDYRLNIVIITVLTFKITDLILSLLQYQHLRLQTWHCHFYSINI